MLLRKLWLFDWNHSSYVLPSRRALGARWVNCRCSFIRPAGQAFDRRRGQLRWWGTPSIMMRSGNGSFLLICSATIAVISFSSSAPTTKSRREDPSSLKRTSPLRPLSTKNGAIPTRSIPSKTRTVLSCAVAGATWRHQDNTQAGEEYGRLLSSASSSQACQYAWSSSMSSMRTPRNMVSPNRSISQRHGSTGSLDGSWTTSKALSLEHGVDAVCHPPQDGSCKLLVDGERHDRSTQGLRNAELALPERGVG